MKSLDKKSHTTDSPKTPGGISKSLLTPIRRLGLSRKWKKSGTSPFVSPLAGNVVKSNENEEGDTRLRKRKLCAEDETQNLPSSPILGSKGKNIELSSTPPSKINADTENTPVRRVATTRKKCKSLISSPEGADNSEVCASTDNQNKSIVLNKKKINDLLENKRDENKELKENKINDNKQLPKKLKMEDSPKKIETQKESIATKSEVSNLDMGIIESEVPNLTKECIVVIQKKINLVNSEIHSTTNENVKETKSMSQVLFDSDSDDVPLSNLNKKDLKQNPVILIQSSDNDDFVQTKVANRDKKEIPNHIVSSITKKAQSSKTTEEKTTQMKKQSLKGKKDLVQADLPLQKSNYFDDDDDDFELNKKTILIKKTYDKVIKPSKSKSTGSITQKDIDEIKARIEMKKKLLIAKSMTKDTEELRGLIKKWQKGCQDALMELLDLMRKKIPDEANMNYSYILEMLKIPPSLVGYNEENECFNTPDDDSILTAAFNDIQLVLSI